MIDGELAARIRDSAKLRDLLVHDYADIDYDILATAIQRVLDDYDLYVQQAARWLQQDEDDAS